MSVEFRVWELTTLLITFFGCVFAFGKILLNQIDRRLTERFAGLERYREKAEASWNEKFRVLLEKQQNESEHLRRIEREILELKAELPKEYVRREDHIRNQTVIEAKLDALYDRLELVQIRGSKDAGKT